MCHSLGRQVPPASLELRERLGLLAVATQLLVARSLMNQEGHTSTLPIFTPYPDLGKRKYYHASLPAEGTSDYLAHRATSSVGLQSSLRPKQAKHSN